MDAEDDNPRFPPSIRSRASFTEKEGAYPKELRCKGSGTRELPELLSSCSIIRLLNFIHVAEY